MEAKSWLKWKLNKRLASHVTEIIQKPKNIGQKTKLNPNDVQSAYKAAEKLHKISECWRKFNMLTW